MTAPITALATAHRRSICGPADTRPPADEDIEAATVLADLLAGLGWEITAKSSCDACGGAGYLLGQTYGEADIPAGWTPVQACDLCIQCDDEHAAAVAAGARDTVACYYEPADIAGLGDWAIRWEAP